MQTQAKPDPKLSEVLAPAFADCNEKDVSDAMLWWGRLSGKLESNWAQPEEDVTICRFAYGDLRTAAQGLRAVAMLSAIIRDGGADTMGAAWLSVGLSAAICGLANSIDDELGRHGENHDR